MKTFSIWFNFQHYKKFNRVKHKTNAWDHWYKVFNMEMEIIGIIDKYESTFGQRGNYDHVYTSHEMLARVKPID